MGMTTTWQPSYAPAHRQSMTTTTPAPPPSSGVHFRTTADTPLSDGKAAYLADIRDRAIAIGMADPTPLSTEALELIARLVSAQRAGRLGLAS